MNELTADYFSIHKFCEHLTSRHKQVARIVSLELVPGWLSGVRVGPARAAMGAAPLDERNSNGYVRHDSASSTKLRSVHAPRRTGSSRSIWVR